MAALLIHLFFSLDSELVKGKGHAYFISESIHSSISLLRFYARAVKLIFAFEGLMVAFKGLNVELLAPS